MARQPLLAEYVWNATITENSVTVPLLKYVADNVRKPNGRERVLGFTIKSDPIKFGDGFGPLDAYMKSMSAEFIHFGNWGTYCISDFMKLPPPEGTAYIRVRGKDPGTLSAEVKITELKKSPLKFNFFTPEGIAEIKRMLGYVIEKKNTIGL